MSLKEQTIIFTDEDAQKNTIMQFPITKAELVEGVMSVEHGGTGATTASAALSNLGGVPISDVANSANKIPRYNANGHLVFPDSSEFWIA